MVQRGDRVYDPSGNGYYWMARTIRDHARAATGLCYAYHEVWAAAVGDDLIVLHNGVDLRVFTLKELNRIGGRWDDGDPVLQWCEELDREPPTHPDPDQP